MAVQQSSVVRLATDHASISKHVQGLRVGPQGRKISIGKNLSQNEILVSGNGWMGNVCQGLFSDLHWHECGRLHAAKGHGNLPQRQAYMIVPYLVDLRVAHAAMSGKNKLDHQKSQSLGLPPQTGVIGHQVVGKVTGSFVGL